MKTQHIEGVIKKSTLAASTLTCCVFICTNLKQTLFKPQIYAAGRCQQARQDFKGKFNCGNCRFRPLPGIEV